MQLRIEPLTPAHVQTYIDFIGNLDFHHAPNWASCYCRFYHTTGDWEKRTGDQNRIDAMEAIKTGDMNGYLAFDGDRCIGWCNCTEVSAYVRIQEDLEAYCKGKRVAASMCFVIHPAYRGKGVATAIVRHATHDFRARGFDAMIALPFESDSPQKRYRGTKHIYERLNYQRINIQDNVSVMWLPLK
jgi:GNAT superfamily N-acetyltransferase